MTTTQCIACHGNLLTNLRFKDEDLGSWCPKCNISFFDHLCDPKWRCSVPCAPSGKRCSGQLVECHQECPWIESHATHYGKPIILDEARVVYFAIPLIERAPASPLRTQAMPICPPPPRKKQALHRLAPNLSRRELVF